MSVQPLTYESVLELIREGTAAFQRDVEKMRRERQESAAEFDRVMKERAAEFDRVMKERDAEFAREMKAAKLRMKKTDERIGDLTGSMGKVIEHMVTRHNIKQFQNLGYFIESHCRNKIFGDGLPDNMKGEIDLLLENGDIAIVIEVKTTFKAKDVGYLLNVIEKFRRYADFKGDKRRFIGAIAGAVVEEEAIKRAHENGFYAIVQSGKAMDIVDVPEGFQAKEW